MQITVSFLFIAYALWYVTRFIQPVYNFGSYSTEYYVERGLSSINDSTRRQLKALVANQVNVKEKGVDSRLKKCGNIGKLIHSGAINKKEDGFGNVTIQAGPYVVMRVYWHHRDELKEEDAWLHEYTPSGSMFTYLAMAVAFVLYFFYSYV